MNIYLAGDSTVQTYDVNRAPQAGWGQFLKDYFTDDVNVVNHAIGGRSSKTFITENRLSKIVTEINEGDYLLIQMGHNDSTKCRTERYTEPYEDYKIYLKQYIDGAHSKQAIPILITPVGRLHYVNQEFLVDFGDYCNAMKEIAEEHDVQIIDLMKMSIEYFSSIGYERAKELFMVSVDGNDCTHFTEKGANEMARLVSRGIKNLTIRLSFHVKE
jgi:lysophospholipase L1-like esterase